VSKLLLKVSGWVLLVVGCSSAGDSQLVDAAFGSDAAVYTTQEGHVCTTDPGADPQLVCKPELDLVCIASYSRRQFDAGVKPVFLCRPPCGTSADCRQPGDVCCSGQIHGRTFDRMAACVPASNCENADAGTDVSPDL
jgi:hypothetical protein